MKTNLIASAVTGESEPDALFFWNAEFNQGGDTHMPANLIGKDVITALGARAAGLDNGKGNPRVKQVVNRLLVDLMGAIDELDISMDEFWTGVA